MSMNPLLLVSYQLFSHMPSLGYGTDHVIESRPTKESIDDFILTFFFTSESLSQVLPPFLFTLGSSLVSHFISKYNFKIEGDG